MAEGKLQRSSGGKFKRNTNGKLVRNNSTSATCCCEGGDWKVMDCCTDVQLEDHTITGVSKPFYFKYNDVCYYAGDENTLSETNLTSEDVEQFDTCADCNTREAKRCSTDAYSDIGVPDVCDATVIYFRQGGICYYVSNTHRYGGATTYNPDAATITNCNDADCCPIDYSDCADWEITVNLASLISCGFCREILPTNSALDYNDTGAISVVCTWNGSKWTATTSVINNIVHGYTDITCTSGETDGGSAFSVEITPDGGCGGFTGTIIVRPTYSALTHAPAFVADIDLCDDSITLTNTVSCDGTRHWAGSTATYSIDHV